MFSKLSLLALVAPLVSALTLSTPSDITSGGSITINWTSATGDPDTFTIELTNPSFNNQFALANNVDPSTGSITLTLPIVPAGGSYTLQAVNIGNINQIYSQTPQFSIGATVTSSVSGSSSPVSATGTTVSLTANSLPATTSTATTPIPTTIFPSTGTGTGTTGTGTGTGTGTTTGAAASTTSSSAAVSSRLALSNTAGFAILMLSAVAGAAAISL